jgi:cytidine deaminase
VPRVTSKTEAVPPRVTSKTEGVPPRVTSKSQAAPPRNGHRTSAPRSVTVDPVTAPRISSPPRALEAPAAAACRRSHALGCTHPRGAALLARGGRVVSAPEIPEPGLTGTGACAERAVAWRAVLEGRRCFTDLLLRGGRGGRGDAGRPCGACLQVLYEFGPRLRVWWGTPRRPRGGLSVRELLPGAFGPDHLVR